jgi:hypothetical protein
MTTAIIHQTSISIDFGISAASITPKAKQLSFIRIERLSNNPKSGEKERQIEL